MKEENIEPHLKTNRQDNVNKIVEKLLTQFAHVFHQSCNELPPWRTVNHEISLHSGHDPPSRAIYRLNQ